MSRAMDTFPSVHSIDSARRASRRATRSTPRSAEGRSRSESNAADTPPPEADATSAHPPAVFSDVVMNRTSARAPNRARAGGAGRVGSRDAVIGRRSGVLGDALSPMPTGGVAGGVGDGTWEVSRSSSEMNDTHDLERCLRVQRGVRRRRRRRDVPAPERVSLAGRRRGFRRHRIRVWTCGNRDAAAHVPPHLRTSENVDQNPRPFSSDSQIFSSARLREGVPG